MVARRAIDGEARRALASRRDFAHHRGVVIVVVQHDAGWRYHVAIEREVVTIGRTHGHDLVLDAPELAAQPMTLVARETSGKVRLGEYTLELEHHHDALEAGLLAAIARGDDPSRLVYADWLEQRGQSAHAEFLRTQLELLRHRFDQPAFISLSGRLRELIGALPYGWRSHLARPVIELGDRARFAFRVGPANADHPADRVVQIWAAGIELTCDDDRVHVPAFSYALSFEVQRVLQRQALPHPALEPAANHRRVAGDEDARARYRWLSCGPTTDNVTAFLFGDREDAILTFAFWRPEHPRPHELGQVFVTRIPAHVLVGQLRDLLDVLKRGV
jgi:uncharacterized protein (TIGR02996 family)